MRDRQRRVTGILCSVGAQTTITGHSRAAIADAIASTPAPPPGPGILNFRKRTKQIIKTKGEGTKPWAGFAGGKLVPRKHHSVSHRHARETGGVAERTMARRTRNSSRKTWQVMKPLAASGLSARDLATWWQAVALGGTVHAISGGVDTLSPKKGNKLVVCFSSAFCANPEGMSIARAYDEIGGVWTREKPGAHSSHCIELKGYEDVRESLLRMRRLPLVRCPYFANAGSGQPAIRQAQHLAGHGRLARRVRESPTTPKA